MDVKRRIAETFAEFTINGKDYFGKSQEEIMALLKAKDTGLDDHSLKVWADFIEKVSDEFAGKGADEIEEDLTDMTPSKVDDFLFISDRWENPL